MLIVVAAVVVVVVVIIIIIIIIIFIIIIVIIIVIIIIPYPENQQLTVKETQWRHAKLSCFDTTELMKMLENVKDEKPAILPKKSKKSHNSPQRMTTIIK